MFSEESCGTENWSYDAENSGLPSQELIITVCVCVCYVFFTRALYLICTIFYVLILSL